MILEILQNDSTSVSTIIYENSLYTNLIFSFLGLLGLTMRTMIKVIRKGGKKIKDLIRYLKNDSLIVLFSFGCYATVILIWWFQGLETLGLYKGSLNISTVFIGLGAESILSTYMKEKLKVDIEQELLPLNEGR